MPIYISLFIFGISLIYSEFIWRVCTAGQQIINSFGWENGKSTWTIRTFASMSA